MDTNLQWHTSREKTIEMEKLYIFLKVVSKKNVLSSDRHYLIEASKAVFANDQLCCYHAARADKMQKEGHLTSRESLHKHVTPV